MKPLKITFVLLIFVLSSCVSDDDPKSVEQLLPIESVVLPTDFPVNETRLIKVVYTRPTTCHLFNGFYVASSGLTNTIAVNSVVLNDKNCEDLFTDNSFEVSYSFTPTTVDTYHLKFWKGKHTNGTDLYLEYDVVVN